MRGSHTGETGVRDPGEACVAVQSVAEVRWWCVRRVTGRLEYG